MKHNWKKYLALFLTGILWMGALSGCGGGAEEQEEETVLNYPVKLHYVSAKYLETGDESIEPMVVVDSVLAIQEDEDEFYETTLELLTLPLEEGTDSMVKDGMVDDVTVTDGVAVVDFNEETMYGGSMEEVYLIEQVVRTLIKSFDEIQAVRFTVDGENVETLMGHLEANCSYGLITVEEDGTDVELVSILAD